MRTCKKRGTYPARRSLPSVAVPAAVLVVASAFLTIELLVVSVAALFALAFFAVAILGVATWSFRRAARRPGATHRVAAGLILGCAMVALGTYRIARTDQVPTPAIVPRGEVAVTATALQDLRPSTSGIRALPVAVDEITDRRGWKGSCRGRTVLLWEGKASIVTTDRTERVVPQRGDALRFTTAPKALGGGTVWLADDDIAVTLRDTELSRIRRTTRKTIKRRFERLERNARGYMVALLLGDRGSVSPETYDAVRRSGAAHVLALSGMHLGVLAFIVSAALRRVVPSTVAVGVSAFVLCGYVWIAGWIPSLLRAIAMVCVASFAAVRSVRPPPPTILARGVLILYLIDPSIVYELGFRYSVLALTGLMWGAPFLVAQLRYILPRWCAVYIGVSAAALACTAPLTLALFGTVYPAGIVMAGALSIGVTLLMWSGLVYIAVAPIPLLGRIAGETIEGGVSVFTAVAGWGARIPALSPGESAPSAMALILGSGIIVLSGSILLFRRRHRIHFDQRKASIGESQFHF